MEWMVKDKVLTDYLQACKEADLSNFKRDPRLTKIFEHASFRQALDYFKLINERDGLLLLNKFTNDLIGNPIKNGFEGALQFSASTLQYIGVLSNLITHFGSLDSLRIVEIGGGYGGQARTICDVYKPACYHIIDLYEVTLLQSRYLKEFDCVDCFTQPTGEEYDLVISNYALSEIPDNKQYMDEVIMKSKHGYITCNTDFVKLAFEHKRLPDIPSEKATNYILIW